MKRSLSLLSAAAGLCIATSSVVSCGISLNRLMGRSIDAETLSSVYYYPVDSWSTALMVGTWDYEILSDTQATLVNTNQYNESYGELAVNYSNEILKSNDPDYVEYGGNVGKPNEDFTKWTYYINPDAYWSTYDGQRKEKIDGDDFVNTIFLVLDTATDSQNISFLQAVFNNDDIVNIQTRFDEYHAAGKDPSSKSDANSPYSMIVDKLAASGTEEIDGVTYDTITFNLGTKKCSFFDTVLTADFYAPTPDFAVKYVSDGNQFIPTSESLNNYGLNHKIPWYSGAYLPKEYIASGNVKLVKNPNYIDHDKVYIKNINYTFASQSYANKERSMFETGDINDANLSVSDTSGWEKYVGSNETNPVFEGTSSSYQTDVTTRLILFNFANTEKNSSGAYTKLRNSLATQSSYVRAYIEYYMNRAMHTSYYSKNGTEQNDTSYIRNTMVPRNFAMSHDVTEVDKPTDNADYSSTSEDYMDIFVQNALKEMSDDGDSTYEKMFEDGSDSFYKNQQTLSFQDRFKISDKVDASLEDVKSNWPSTITNTAQLRDTVLSEINSIKSRMRNNSEIVLDYIISNADANTVAKHTIEMIEDFNMQARADGVGFEINPILASSADEYLQWRTDGSFDISSSGWQPDFADPGSYLETMSFKGGLDSRYGGTRLFSKADPDAFIGVTSTEDHQPVSYDQLKDPKNHYLTDFGYALLNAADPNNSGNNTSNLGYRIVWQFYRRLYDFTDEYFAADNFTSTVHERYTEFAQAEFDLIYRYSLVFPLGIQDGDYKIKLTYVRPRTQSSVAYGSAQYKHVGVQMTDHLLNKNERAIIENNYQEELKHRKGIGK